MPDPTPNEATEAKPWTHTPGSLPDRILAIRLAFPDDVRDGRRLTVEGIAREVATLEAQLVENDTRWREQVEGYAKARKSAEDDADHLQARLAAVEKDRGDIGRELAAAQAERGDLKARMEVWCYRADAAESRLAEAEKERDMCRTEAVRAEKDQHALEMRLAKAERKGRDLCVQNGALLMALHDAEREFRLGAAANALAVIKRALAPASTVHHGNCELSSPLAESCGCASRAPSSAGGEKPRPPGMVHDLRFTITDIGRAGAEARAEAIEQAAKVAEQTHDLGGSALVAARNIRALAAPKAEEHVHHNACYLNPRCPLLPPEPAKPEAKAERGSPLDCASTLREQASHHAPTRTPCSHAFASSFLKRGQCKWGKECGYCGKVWPPKPDAGEASTCPDCGGPIGADAKCACAGVEARPHLAAMAAALREKAALEQVERLRAELAEAQNIGAVRLKLLDQKDDRIIAAEAEAKRLREALEKVLLVGRGTSGRIILDASDEAALRAALAQPAKGDE